MFCARCKNRLAVDLYTDPAGKVSPLCRDCFGRKTRDVDTAMKLLRQQGVGRPVSMLAVEDLDAVLPSPASGSNGGNSMPPSRRKKRRSVPEFQDLSEPAAKLER